jgi:uncharacterized protein
MRITRRGAIRSLAGLGLAAAGAGAYGFGYERHHFVVTRTTLPLPSLPARLAGLRIGLVSDIHCGEFMSADRVAQAAGLLMAERPDIILLGGDHVTWGRRQDLPACADGLSALAAPLGVFAVPGNHDPEAALGQVFESHGRIRVLRDEHVNLRARGTTITLGGLRYWSQRTSDVRRGFEGAAGFPILLAHDPRRLPQAAEARVPLVLSGHTHGGQVMLPLVGSPAAWRFPVVAGLARQQATSIYVTRGLGTVVVPIRLNCPPEVSLLTLDRSPAA